MFAQVFLALLVAQGLFAHPLHYHQESGNVAKRQEASGNELDILFEGNKQFVANLDKSDPGLLKKLTDEGQAPPFMFLGCSDSRVSEGTIFNAKPGTLFTERNIANQFHHTDANAHSVLSYAVAELGVKHVIVMGHYGCGGVAASIASPPEAPIDAANGAVQNWIAPIRQIFQTSTRAEIVALREANAKLAVVEEPEPQEPGFRALVEENVKAGVARIVSDSVIANHFSSLAKAGNGTEERRAEGEPIGDVFVHGFVYDIETGEIVNLGISVGPPGKAIPTIPFATVKQSAESSVAAHGKVEAIENASSAGHVQARCEQMCQVKRSILGHLPWSA